MKDKLEKIDLIKERANISYQAAKEALERNDYDVVETLIDLERQDKLKDETPEESFTTSKKSKSNYETSEKKYTPSEDGIAQSIKELFRKSMRTSFILKDSNNEQVLKLPLLIAILLVLFTIPFSIVVLVLAIVFKYKIIIRHDDGKSTCVNQVIDDLNEKYDARKEEKSDSCDQDDQDAKEAENKVNLHK